MSDVYDLVQLLRQRGVVVNEWGGWYGRGNGIGQIDIRGAIIHHTGTNFGSAFQALVTGRPGLPGMLCNFSGNSDGTLTVIGTGLAWHAGGGNGPNEGPLAPYAQNRNYYTVGLEIVYPGTQPMTNAQYITAGKFAKAVADLFCGGNIQYIRGHGEVNGKGEEGKWDPGYASGLMIDMNKFRADALNQEDELATSAELIQQMYNEVSKTYTERGVPFGDAMVKWLDWHDGIEQGTGTTPAAAFTQVYDVVAENFVESGEALGKTTADTEKKVDALTAAVIELKTLVTSGGVDAEALADALIEHLDVELVKK